MADSAWSSEKINRIFGLLACIANDDKRIIIATMIGFLIIWCERCLAKDEVGIVFRH